MNFNVGIDVDILVILEEYILIEIFVMIGFS